MGRSLSGAFIVALLVAACGSSDDDDDDPSGTTGRAWSDVTVPANIDVESCKSESQTYMNGKSPCHDCCTAAGFSTSSGIADDHCTCGNPPNDGRDTVCASETATGDVCGACCDAAGFTGHGWAGGTSPSCQCFGWTDSEVCSAALQDSDPAEACAMCCVEQGFISMGYLGIGERECSCISG